MAGKQDGPSDAAAEPRFEDALAELEGLVRRLEQGDLPLEESLVDFERGMGLVKQLSKRLEEIERRVEVLLAQNDGELAVQPLDDEAEA